MRLKLLTRKGDVAASSWGEVRGSNPRGPAKPFAEIQVDRPSEGAYGLTGRGHRSLSDDP